MITPIKSWLLLASISIALTNVAWSQNSSSVEKRYALVIGNSEYQNGVPKLPNPLNDASDMAALLRACHFDVILVTNGSYSQVRESIKTFYEKLSAGPKGQTVGLFYYAGHGLQYENENYLVPVDANIQYSDDIVRMGVPVQRTVLANMERSNSTLNIVILDACRNNPFPAASREMGAGLAEVQKAKGAFIAYATAPGSVASDGSGRNGLYTQELLKAMSVPGLPIEQVFKLVRRNVLKLSGEKQYTWDSSNILGDFYFVTPTENVPNTQLLAAETTVVSAPPASSPEVVASRVISKGSITNEALGGELMKLTSSSIPFAQRQSSKASVLKHFVVPHAFVYLMIGPRIDERIAANKLMDRLVTLPDTNIKVVKGEYSDSGRIIELYVELEE